MKKLLLTLLLALALPAMAVATEEREVQYLNADGETDQAICKEMYTKEEILTAIENLGEDEELWIELAGSITEPFGGDAVRLQNTNYSAGNNIICGIPAGWELLSGAVINCGVLNFYAKPDAEKKWKIIAEGKNDNAGIVVRPASTLTVNDGYIQATGGSNGGAGIRNEGSMTINRSSVMAQGKGSGAGISNAGVQSTLTIKGDSSSVMAQGKGSGAGISNAGEQSTLTISGGSVKAIGGSNDGAGISNAGEKSTLTISGGSVTATGGSNDGAGISSAGVQSTLTISGGSLTATGGDNGGAGISSDGYPSTLTISGGSVTATGGSNGGAGIINGGSVTISGGSVTAQGKGSGTGIGSVDSVTISGGSVTATGGDNGGAGISSADSVTISGGSVTATGGGSGAGISSDRSVTISGGSVTATGGDSGGKAISCKLYLKPVEGKGIVATDLANNRKIGIFSSSDDDQSSRFSDMASVQFEEYDVTGVEEIEKAISKLPQPNRYTPGISAEDQVILRVWGAFNELDSAQRKAVDDALKNRLNKLTDKLRRYMPNTGDSSGLLLWLLLGAAAIVGIGALLAATVGKAKGRGIQS